MTEETKKCLEEWQRATSENLRDLAGGVFDTNDQMELLNLIEKSQKILLEDERMTFEREKLKIETDKYEYQKKQEALAHLDENHLNWVKTIGMILKESADTAFKGFSIGVMKYGIEADQYGIISGKTTRSLYDFWTKLGVH